MSSDDRSVMVSYTAKQFVDRGGNVQRDEVFTISQNSAKSRRTITLSREQASEVYAQLENFLGDREPTIRELHARGETQ